MKLNSTDLTVVQNPSEMLEAYDDSYPMPKVVQIEENVQLADKQMTRKCSSYGMK